MAIPSTGNISIKEAAGSTRSIDTAVTSTSSGSLVTLGQNSINYTGGRSSITNDTDASPYSMLEYSGYAHTLNQSNSETFVGRNSSQSGQMVRIYELDQFNYYSVIDTGHQLRMHYYYSGSTYYLKMYVKWAYGGVTYNRKYYNSSNSSTNMTNSTWILFNTVTSSHGWDTINLIQSITQNETGYGIVGDGTLTQTDGDYGASYNLNPAGTAVNTVLNGNFSWKMQFLTTAECTDGTMEWIALQNIRLTKSGYYDWNSTAWKAVMDHNHDQAGSC